MPHYLKIHSLVLPVLFLITVLSSIVNTAPVFKNASVSNCKELKCASASTSSNGTPAGATSSGDDGLFERTEIMTHESLPTKKGTSPDLNLSGNDQLTEIVSLAGSTDIEMKVTTDDVLSAVNGGTDSKRIAKSTNDECMIKVHVGLPVSTEASNSLPQRAMCRWGFTTNTNEQRRPRDMQFAELQSDAKCIDSAGKEVNDSHCQLVYYQANVKRLVGGSWVSDYEHVPVAGVCVKSK